jgi:sugar transferase (PEP-CTERM/EpsH1 system associated)
MGAWVRDLLARRPINRIVVYSSAMAQYARMPLAEQPRRVIDYVDVDAEKWRQYAERRRGPMAWLYAREARCLLAHDADAAHAWDMSLFVSPPEAALFRRLARTPDTVAAVPNGVDLDFFSPRLGRMSPFGDGAMGLVFTGAMDYWANVDAVRWFATDVWPLVRRRMPCARLYVVGARPSRAIRQLACKDIVITGRVPDVRPYLQHAAGIIAPMRIARGIQNKVLEGMAMGRVVLTTSAGLEGIGAEPGRHLLVADEPITMAARAAELLNGQHAEIGAAARALISARYDWRDAKQQFLDIVGGNSMQQKVDA